MAAQHRARHGARRFLGAGRRRRKPTAPPPPKSAPISPCARPARLPAALLARDWSQCAGVPPCLTKPAMACDAFFPDLDGDGRDEILLAYGNDARWWAA